jgi:hypothetical protein
VGVSGAPAASTTANNTIIFFFIFISSFFSDQPFAGRYFFDAIRRQVFNPERPFKTRVLKSNAAVTFRVGDSNA